MAALLGGEGNLRLRRLLGRLGGGLGSLLGGSLLRRVLDGRVRSGLLCLVLLFLSH
jgi:hypothetical protein